MATILDSKDARDYAVWEELMGRVEAGKEKLREAAMQAAGHERAAADQNAAEKEGLEAEASPTLARRSPETALGDAREPDRMPAETRELVEAMDQYFQAMERAYPDGIEARGRELTPPEGYFDAELAAARERVDQAMDKVRERAGEMSPVRQEEERAGIGETAAAGSWSAVEHFQEQADYAAAAENDPDGGVGDPDGGGGGGGSGGMERDDDEGDEGEGGGKSKSKGKEAERDD